jgi:TRAP-type uncharacterized transport system fused permease subunit
MSNRIHWITRAAMIGAVSWSVFHLYTAGTDSFQVMVQRPIHVGFALILTFLLEMLRRFRKVFGAYRDPGIF